MMTHRGLVHEYVSGIHALQMTEDDEPLHAMPLYHSARDAAVHAPLPRRRRDRTT